MTHENVSPITGSQPDASQPDPQTFLPGTDHELGEFLNSGAPHACGGA